MDRILNAPLSASRISKFEQCRLAWRFRYVDEKKERPSAAQVRGNLVHLALEKMFAWPPAERQPTAVRAILSACLEELLAEQPERAAAIDQNLPWPAEAYPISDEAKLEFASSCGEFVDTYFQLENPQQISPSHLEVLVKQPLPNGFELLGYIDRVETNGGGLIRITDYKTGKTPALRFQAKAWFQLRLYAWLVWRAWGTVPTRLQLIYLSDGQIIQHAPDEADLLALEGEVVSISNDIEDAVRSGQFPPNKSPLCAYCSFQELCPVFGGSPPPLPYQAN